MENKLTVEEERNEKLLSLDTLRHWINGMLKFSMYRKLINKNYFMHYLSWHDKRMNSGRVILSGFYGMQ